MANPSLVQALAGSSNYPPSPATYANPVAAGDLLVCAVQNSVGTFGTVTVADTVNPSNWLLLPGSTYYNAAAACWVGLFGIYTLAGTPTVTATCQTAQGGSILIAEFSGVSTSAVADATAIQTGGGASTEAFALSNVVNKYANTLLLAAFTSTYTPTGPTGWTQAVSANNALFYAFAAAANTATPFAGTFGGSANWAAVTAGISVASTPGGNAHSGNAQSGNARSENAYPGGNAYTGG